MSRQIRIALGAVAGVLLLVAAGLWLSDGGSQPQPVTEVVEVAEPKPPVIPVYDDPTRDTSDSDQDDQAGDVTRIIIREPAITEQVNIDEVLAGKVIVDDQVVTEPEG